MQDFIDLTNILTPAEHAEIFHVLHIPAATGYRTALLLPGWTVLTEGIRLDTIAKRPDLARLRAPLLSISVDASFYGAVQGSRGATVRPFSCMTDDIIEAHMVLLEAPGHALGVVFDARAPLIADAILQWGALGFLPIILRTNDNRMMFLAMPYSPIAIKPENLLATPIPPSRIVSILKGLRFPGAPDGLPQQRAIAVVTSPESIFSIVEMIDGIEAAVS